MTEKDIPCTVEICMKNIDGFCTGRIHKITPSDPIHCYPFLELQLEKLNRNYKK